MSFDLEPPELLFIWSLSLNVLLRFWGQWSLFVKSTDKIVM